MNFAGFQRIATAFGCGFSFGCGLFYRTNQSVHQEYNCHYYHFWMDLNIPEKFSVVKEVGQHFSNISEWKFEFTLFLLFFSLVLFYVLGGTFMKIEINLWVELRNAKFIQVIWEHQLTLVILLCSRRANYDIRKASEAALHPTSLLIKAFFRPKIAFLISFWSSNLKSSESPEFEFVVMLA